MQPQGIFGSKISLGNLWSFTTFDNSDPTPWKVDRPIPVIRSGPGHPLHPSTLLLQFQALPRLKHSMRRSARLRGTDLLVVQSSHEAAAHLHHPPPERRLKKGSLYSWWKKSVHGTYPVIYRILYIPGGAGFLPATVLPTQTTALLKSKSLQIINNDHQFALLDTPIYPQSWVI